MGRIVIRGLATNVSTLGGCLTAWFTRKIDAIGEDREGLDRFLTLDGKRERSDQEKKTLRRFFLWILIAVLAQGLLWESMLVLVQSIGGAILDGQWPPLPDGRIPLGRRAFLGFACAVSGMLALFVAVTCFLAYKNNADRIFGDQAARPKPLAPADAGRMPLGDGDQSEQIDSFPWTGRASEQIDGERAAAAMVIMQFFLALIAAGLCLEAIFELVKFVPAGWWTVPLLLLTFALTFCILAFAVGRTAQQGHDLFIADSSADDIKIPVEKLYDRAYLQKTIRDYDALIIPLSEGDGAAVELGDHVEKSRDRRLERVCQEADNSKKWKCNWQQVFRAIRPHLMRREQPHLPQIHLLTTRESAKDYQAFEGLFEKVFGDLLGDRKPGDFLHVAGDHLDFEDYSAVYQRLNQLRDKLERDHGEGNVLIDMTGGQKPLACAALAISLRRPGDELSYVTNDGDFRIYKVRARSPDSLPVSSSNPLAA